MKVYLIHPELEGFTASEVHVVKANNKEEARQKAIRFFAKDELFHEYVQDLSATMGFLAEFFKDEEGEFLDEYGYYVPRMVKTFGEDVDKMDDYVEINVELNVRKFFGENEAYADLLVIPFLNHESFEGSVPLGMCEYILDKQDFNFFGGMLIKEVKFDD